jgi:ferredoxin-NADP reductase
MNSDRKAHRAYSIVDLSPDLPAFWPELPQELAQTKTGQGQYYLSLMISTKPGGIASTYFEQIDVGASSQLMGPNGKFKINPSDRGKIFICSGTGLAPFVPMMRQVLYHNPEAEVKLFFAVWTQEDDFAKSFISDLLDKNKYPHFDMYTVIDEWREEDLAEPHNLGGRVTDQVPKNVPNLVEHDFYLCGHPGMVAAMEEELVGLGCQHIFKEKFGK